MKRTGLVIVIIICLVLFFSTLIGGALLTARTIGWNDLRNKVQLRDRVADIFENLRLPVSWARDKASYSIDEVRTVGLEGISEIKITAIAESVRIDTQGTEVEARLSGSYTSWGEKLVWHADRQGDRLVIYAEYPHLGLVMNDLDIQVSIPAAFTGNVKISSVSGDCILPGTMDRSWSSLQFNGVSGSLDVDRAGMPSVSASSISGSLTLNQCGGQVNGDSVSGKVYTAWERFSGGHFKTVSGQVELVLPVDADAAVTFTTVSGGFRNDGLPLSIISQDKRKLTGTLGQGLHSLTVNTVSGDLVITSQP